MTLQEFLKGKGKLDKDASTEWLPFCTLTVKSGRLWAGDPYLPNAEDGCVAEVPPGVYAVEGRGKREGRDRYVARLRVYLSSEAPPDPGEEIGETGTDSCMMGVCDIAPFEAIKDDQDNESINEALEEDLDADFGVFTMKRFPDLEMPFVPTMSDGSGPVLGLFVEGRCIGIELSFDPEADE
jgi:hypothetical protein